MKQKTNKKSNRSEDDFFTSQLKDDFLKRLIKNTNFWQI